MKRNFVCPTWISSSHVACTAWFRICAQLRSDYSPRHVPDKIYQVDGIPYTISGKKMEVPVRKILMGTPLEKAANVGVMSNPDSLEFFLNYIKQQQDYSLK